MKVSYAQHTEVSVVVTENHHIKMSPNFRYQNPPQKRTGKQSSTFF